MLQLLKCSTLDCSTLDNGRKMLFGCGAAVWCWGSCTAAGGMLLLVMLYKWWWLCFCWWFCFFSLFSLMYWFFYWCSLWWTWWWISLLFMEIILFGQHGTGVAGGETTESMCGAVIHKAIQVTRSCHFLNIVASFRCLFSVYLLPMEIFQQLLNLWYCEGGVSSFTLSILNNSKSSSFMVLVKKQKSPQGWIETVPTAAATTEENGEEEEKVKRLEELTSSDKKIEQSIQIGTKYVNTQLHWEKQLEDEITSTTEFTKLKDYQNKRHLLIFTPAIPTTFKNVVKFKN
uniref:Uncharacterized protein n=1 Tax=Meloidogyne enterolobii TaxID=390850 RepID=A0A6V7UJV5_MELEN|nr:unnamed protein product [Meloidogyne enterolobii]